MSKNKNILTALKGGNPAVKKNVNSITVLVWWAASCITVFYLFFFLFYITDNTSQPAPFMCLENSTSLSTCTSNDNNNIYCMLIMLTVSIILRLWMLLSANYIQ